MNTTPLPFSLFTKHKILLGTFGTICLGSTLQLGQGILRQLRSVSLLSSKSVDVLKALKTERRIPYRRQNPVRVQLSAQNPRGVPEQDPAHQEKGNMEGGRKLKQDEGGGSGGTALGVAI